MELTKEYFEEYLDKKFTEKFADFTKNELAKALEPLATKKDVRDAVEELAGFVAETVANPMEERFQKVEERFQQIDVRFQETNLFMEKGFKKVDEKFVHVNDRLDKLETNGSWTPRVHKLETDMGKIKNALYLS